MPSDLTFTAEFWSLDRPAAQLSDIDFSSPADYSGTRSKIQKSNATNAFWDGGSEDHFAARYTADLTIEKSGNYTFYVTADNKSMLSLAGHTILEDTGDDSDNKRDQLAVKVYLEAGTYPLELIYFERSGPQTLMLDWKGPDTGHERLQLSANDAPSTQEDPDVPLNAAGFAVAYFAMTSALGGLADVDFDGTPAATGVVGELDISHQDGRFWEGGKSNFFGASYNAALKIEEAGTYTFFLTSDGSSSLGIDGDTLILQEGPHRVRTEKITVNLDAGVHDLEVLYADWKHRSSLQLEWRGPDTDGERVVLDGKSVTPAVAPPPDQDFEGFTAEFWLADDDVNELSDIDWDSTPYAIGERAALDISLTTDPFWDNGPKDYFAARYTTTLTIDEAGSYTFFLTSDDGSSMSIGGVEVIDNDGLHPERTEKVSVELTEGSHEIEVLYFERKGEQVLELDWRGPDTDGERELLAGDMLGSGPADQEPPDTGGGNDGGNDGGGSGDDDDDGGHGGGDDDDDHGHDASIDGYDGPIPPTTAKQIDNFIAAVIADGEDMMHDHGDSMMVEHMQVLDLVPRDGASHIAIANGDWTDPDTWANGDVPGAGDTVLIPKGITVDYDAKSNASLFTVRVDGKLDFATDKNTKMVVDTMVVSSTGKLEIGTEANPLDAKYTADIQFADNGNIDTDWDPGLFSRGLISLGDVAIHGAEKDAFLTVGADPMKGDTSITLSERPDGWEVGDTIVLTGTNQQGWGFENGKKKFFESEDEEVTITAINGKTITLDQPLKYDHDAPGDHAAYVSNMTRNVTFSSEGGDDLPVHQRGHTMFMHSNDVDVRHAGFVDLGRTDKSEAAFDPEDLGNLKYDDNLQGRYSVHFHRTGTEDLENPAIAVGNVVDGNPGWGFVHHSSHAEFTDNVAFDVFGAAFAAEEGDETGIWLRNMAIKTEGIGWGEWNAKEGPDVERDDLGRTGDGFFFASRAVEAAENVAANTTHGFVYMSRGTDGEPLSSSIEHPEIAYGEETIGANDVPIAGFRDNESFGNHIGLMVIKGNPSQNHDTRSVLEGFTAWEARQGANFSYTGHYTLIDFDVTGTRDQENDAGLVVGTNTFDLVANGFVAEGYEIGVDFSGNKSLFSNGGDFDNIIIDPVFIDVDKNYEGRESNRHIILDSDDLKDGRLSFDYDGKTVLKSSEDLWFAGDKTDSIGTNDRQFDGDRQGIRANSVDEYLAGEGYYTLPDGTPVIVVEDLVADRATGDLLKLAHIIELDMPKALDDAKYNGVINPGGQGPNTKNDSASVAVDGEIYLDVLKNDSDPDGGDIWVDGFTDPYSGDVFLQDDGTLLYRPNRGFEGTDNFEYWARDEEGNFEKATVTITVDDSLL